MLIESIIILAIIFFSAILGSMIGVGGGFLMVPLLTLLMGLPIHEAIALSLLAIVAISSSATITYSSSKYVNYKLGLILETTTVLGAFAGARVSIILPQNILATSFGILLIYAGYRMIKNIKFEAKEVGSLSKGRIAIGALFSFFAGLASGLLGIGGGVLKVPIMVLILDLPTKIAIGTSEFMISITSVSGSYVYYRAGILSLYNAASAITGGFLGAQLGSRISVRIKGEVLRRIFGLMMLLFAVLMILKGLGVSI